MSDSMWIILVFTCVIVLATDAAAKEKLSRAELERYVERYDHVLMGNNTVFLRAKWNEKNRTLFYERFNTSIFTTLPPVALPRMRTQRTRDWDDGLELMDNETVYPQILITVDDFYFRKRNYDLDATLSELFTYWTGVDLAFRKLTKPKVRLSIAGIILPADENATGEYFKANQILHQDQTWLVGSGTLAAMRKYFNDEFTRDLGCIKVPYDFVVGMTGTKVVRRSRIDPFDIKEELGISSMARACERTNVLVEGRGFENLNIAVFHLAHLLGAPEDTIENFNENGVPCTYQEMTYMSDRTSYLATEWSTCSIEGMEKYLKSEAASCLRNKPDIGKPYKKHKLPGQLFKRDEACKARDFEPPNEEQRSDCKLSKCQECHRKWTSLWISKECEPKILGAVLEGEQCGGDKICISGQCVNDFLKEQDEYDNEQ